MSNFRVWTNHVPRRTKNTVKEKNEEKPKNKENGWNRSFYYPYASETYCLWKFLRDETFHSLLETNRATIRSKTQGKSSAANRSPELIWIFVSLCKRQSGGKFRPANRDVTVVPLQNRPSQFRNFSYFGATFLQPLPPSRFASFTGRWFSRSWQRGSRYDNRTKSFFCDEVHVMST